MKDCPVAYTTILKIGSEIRSYIWISAIFDKNKASGQSYRAKINTDGKLYLLYFLYYIHYIIWTLQLVYQKQKDG